MCGRVLKVILRVFQFLHELQDVTIPPTPLPEAIPPPEALKRDAVDDSDGGEEGKEEEEEGEEDDEEEGDDAAPVPAQPPPAPSRHMVYIDGKRE
jgi:hypothetical protein